jgi:tRNA modification GTPase
VANKIDLLAQAERVRMMAAAGPDRIWISARTGEGMEALRQRIREAAGAAEQTGGPAAGSFSARQRHIDALQRAGGHLEAGRQVMAVSRAGELLAEELRLAQQALGELTGEMLPDDLLGAIFASFCIGK